MCVPTNRQTKHQTHNTNERSHRQASMHYHRQNVPVDRAFMHPLTSIILVLSFPLTDRLIIKMLSQTNCICYHRYKRIYAFSLTDRQNIYSTPQTQCINAFPQTSIYAFTQTNPSHWKSIDALRDEHNKHPFVPSDRQTNNKNVLNDELYRGARKLAGENLKLVWAEFSTIS
jgi:hypothetical protein